MSWPIAAARSHRPARRRPAPHPPPMSPPKRTPNPRPRHALEQAGCSPPPTPGKPCTPARELLPSLGNGVSRGGTCISAGRVSASVRLFREDFCKPGARQEDCKAPRKVASPCSPRAPLRLPLPSQQAGTRGDLPRRPASDPALVTAAVKGRLMGGFYYSQFCGRILPLFIMAFPPRDEGETQGKAGAGSVCSNVSRCVFKAMVFGAKLSSALPIR